MKNQKAFIAALMFSAGIASAQIPEGMTIPSPEDFGVPQEAGQNVLRQMFSKNFAKSDMVWPLLVASSDLCSDKAYHAGLDKNTLPVQLVQGGRSNASPGADVLHVFPDSPAFKAGLVPGDKILAINGQSLGKGKKANEKFRKYEEKSLKSGNVITYTVVQNGQQKDVQVTPVQVCDYHVSMMVGGIGFAATGETGVLAFDQASMGLAETDDEKRVVIAHEIAHHILGHVKTRSRMAKAGRALDRVAGFAGIPTMGALGGLGAVATKAGDEHAADLKSIEILKRIGISSEQVLEFWKKVRANQDDMGRYNRSMNSHPLSDGRIEKLEEYVAQHPTPVDENRIDEIQPDEAEVHAFDGNAPEINGRDAGDIQTTTAVE